MSARFLLDTDTVSYALRGHGNVAERILDHQPTELCISAITLGELRHGAIRLHSMKLQRLIDAFISKLEVLPFDAECAGYYGVLMSELERLGTPIGHLDTQIAAHAMALGATLVTNNVRHFERLRRLRVENWT